MKKVRTLVLAVIITCNVFANGTMDSAVYEFTNYPPLVVNSIPDALPQGPWFYTFCTLPNQSMFGPGDQVLWMLDSLLRPVFTRDIGPRNMAAQGWGAYLSGNVLGYNADQSYPLYFPNHPQPVYAKGMFPRYELSARGFVPKDTLWGAPIKTNHMPAPLPVPLLDAHGIALHNAMYAIIIDNSSFGADTGTTVAVKNYDDSLLGTWTSQDPLEGMPQEQSAWYHCPDYHYFPINDADHPNSIVWVGDSLLLVSFRHQNEIICLKFNHQTGAITREWRLRHDLFSSFTWLNDSLGFSGQHCLSVLKDSAQELTIGLFDNGNCSGYESRYMEIVLDRHAMTAFVRRSQWTGYSSVAMGGAVPIDTTDNVQAPILVSEGIYVNHSAPGSTNTIEVVSAAGEKLAGIKFQFENQQDYANQSWVVYQAHAYFSPIIQREQPKIRVTCINNDSMAVSVDKTYDAHLWMNGKTDSVIMLPRTEHDISVTVSNVGTLGEWHAYSDGNNSCILATQVEAVDIPSFTVYPNPANTKLFVTASFQQKAGAIYDIIGSWVENVQIDSQTSIDVSSFPAGMYFLKVEQSTKKFTVSH